MEVNPHKVLSKELFQTGGIDVTNKEDVFMIELAGWLLRHFKSLELGAVDEDKTCVDRFEPGISFEGDVFEAHQSNLKRIKFLSHVLRKQRLLTSYAYF